MRGIHFSAIPLTFSAVLWIGSSNEAADLNSGPQVGQRLDTFQVRDCTGPAAGKTLCYVCRYGARPMAVIFTRRIGDDLGRLAERIDRAIARHRDRRLAAVVVYLGPDTADAEQRLKQLAELHHLAFTPLTIYKDSAVRLANQLHISPRASLTVVFCRDTAVQESLSFESDRIGDTAIDTITGKAERLLESSRPPKQAGPAE